MLFKIGFATESSNEARAEVAYTAPQTPRARKSVVQVYFESRGMTLAYYNDRFDLKRGDLVFVDGKLEGLRGRVTEVNYNFKINLTEYKRVIAVADTDVHGSFFSAGSHFVTFDPLALPYEKIAGWLVPPAKEDDEFVTGNDDTSFPLIDLGSLDVRSAVAGRGQDYYLKNKVRYICIDGTRGRAIVEGSKAYELEFEYRDGQISGLVCSCFCSYHCKHEVAAMLQLRETLEIIEKQHATRFEQYGYFAAVAKDALFEFAVDGKENAVFTL